MINNSLLPNGEGVNPTPKARNPKKQPAPTIRVVIEPLPLPPDFAERLSKIYAMAALRYREHHEKQAVR